MLTAFVTLCGGFEPHHYFGSSEGEVWRKFLEDYRINLVEEENSYSTMADLLLDYGIEFMDMVNLIDERPFFYPIIHRLEDSISDLREELENSEKEEILETIEVILW